MNDIIEMAELEKAFLSGEWLLAILNYAVDPSLLRAHVPNGTTLDSFEGKIYLSLVGFRFNKTKLFGKISVPFHSEFEEVNLRFYVRRETGTETRRGVLFIKEIVPKPAIALTARAIYGENYVSFPMKHKITLDANKTELGIRGNTVVSRLDFSLTLRARLNCPLKAVLSNSSPNTIGVTRIRNPAERSNTT